METSTYWNYEYRIMDRIASESVANQTCPLVKHFESHSSMNLVLKLSKWNVNWSEFWLIYDLSLVIELQTIRLENWHRCY